MPSSTHGGSPTETASDTVTSVEVLTDAPATASAPSHQAVTAESISPAPRGSRITRPEKESLREQKKARARELILNCAQQLINNEGYAETKMRDVAAAASMSYQTLYNYFPTKGLILQELLTRDLLKLRRSTSDIVRSNDPLSTRLRDFAKGYIDAIAPEERHLWKEVCAELLKVTSHHSCFLALLDDQALNKLRDLLANARDHNELDPHVDSDTLAGVLYSLLDAMLMRYLVNGSLSRPNILSTISAQMRLTVTPYLR